MLNGFQYDVQEVACFANGVMVQINSFGVEVVE